LIEGKELFEGTAEAVNSAPNGMPDIEHQVGEDKDHIDKRKNN